MAYPLTFDTIDTSMSGTTALATDDHALNHRVVGSAIGALETVIGTTAGTNVLMSFAAGNFPAPINAAGVLQQVITGGTANQMVFGTATLTGSQFSGSANLTAGTLTSPQINGTVTANGTINGLIFGVTIAPGVGTIVDAPGGTEIVNAQAANIYYSVQGTTAGNRTIGTPLNPQPYQQLTYAYKASGSANGTLIWSSVFRISQDAGTPVIGTSTSWNYFGWRYNGIDSKWDFLGQTLNLI